MKHTAKVFKALSDPNRIRILKMLEIRPLCVCEITGILSISTSTASKHLQILRDAGFIYDRKDGKFVEYALNTGSADPTIQHLLTFLPSCCREDEEVQSYSARLGTIDRYTICNITL